MRIYDGSEHVADAHRRAIVTVGNFDGVHLGHRELLRQVIERAGALGCPAGAYTFDPHPRRVLFPDRPQPLLMTSEQLAQELETVGLDVLVREPFTREFGTQTAEEFVSRILAERLRPREVFVGRDFHFGKGRGGSVETLEVVGPTLGIAVHVIDQVRAGGRDVSSTRVRDAVSSGDLADAALCLSRYYTVWGSVARGDQRGRTLGFPTANLDPENELLPAAGVYATRVRPFDGDRPGGEALDSVTNVGTRPTFTDGRVLAEAHVLDFDGDLYGRRIALEFVGRIRPERKFSGPDALKLQIADDVAAARGLLSTAG